MNGAISDALSEAIQGGDQRFRQSGAPPAGETATAATSGKQRPSEAI